jgi:hypothetical protein
MTAPPSARPESEYGSAGTNFNRTFPGVDTGGPATQLGAPRGLTVPWDQPGTMPWPG